MSRDHSADTPEAILPPAGTAFGDRIRQRLEGDTVIWMTTVGRDGTPQPNPVWFLWDGETILIYSRADAARVAHIRSRPRLSLNFDGDGRGGNIAVITGEGRIDSQAPPAGDNEPYVEKYRGQIARIGHDPGSFAQAYPVAIRVQPTKVRGF